MAPRDTNGEALMRLLGEAGFEVAFGIPGVHTLELYRGVAKSGMRHVLARHEQGVGFMADGYARASGKPGLCLVITGPGVTNIATAMGQAYSDSVPVLVISSANARDDLGRGRGRLHESTDQVALTAALTALAALPEDPGLIPGLIGQAMRIFASERPRPVHLHIPIDELGKPAGGKWHLERPIPAPAPDKAAVAEARKRLSAAVRPVIVVGGGAVAASNEVRALAESLEAAVVTTTAGKGVLPESHPLSVGATLQLQTTQAMLADADLVLAIGTELAETDSWTTKPLVFGGPLIRVDLDPAKLVDDHRADLAVRADAAAFLRALGPLGEGRNSRDAVGRAREVRRANAASWGALARRHIAVLDSLRQALPAHGFVASDMTQIAYTGNCTFPVEYPRSWFHPNGFGTLGYALPAAIGAMIAVPDRPGLALAGDYGFQFTLPELGTAVELGLSLPVVLWNNEGLGQIRDDMVASGIPETGVKARNPDFLALARAYGCGAERPENLPALSQAVTRALAAGRPTLIEVRPDIAGG